MTTQSMKRSGTDTAGNETLIPPGTPQEPPRSTSSRSTFNLGRKILSIMTTAIHNQYLKVAAKTYHPKVMAYLDARQWSWSQYMYPSTILPHPSPQELPKPSMSLASHQPQVIEVFYLIKDINTQQPEDDVERWTVAYNYSQKFKNILWEMVTPVTGCKFNCLIPDNRQSATPAEDVQYETKRDVMEAIRAIFEILLVNTEDSEVGRNMRRIGLDCLGEWFLHPVLRLFSEVEIRRLMDWKIPNLYVTSISADGNHNNRGFVDPTRGSTAMITWLEAFQRMHGEAQRLGFDGDGSLGTAKVMRVLDEARVTGSDTSTTGTVLATERKAADTDREVVEEAQMEESDSG